MSHSRLTFVGLMLQIVSSGFPGAQTQPVAPAGRRRVLRNQGHRSVPKPLFLYLAFNAAHTRMEAPEKYLNRFADIKDERRRTYAAMVSAMDDGIGTVLATLREQNLDQNTLVVFFNDNGGPTMESTTVNGSSNAPLRGSKRTTWEGGIRVPFIMRWTGQLPAGRVDTRPIIQLDVLPTALAAAGIDAGQPSRLDGVDLCHS